MLYNLVDSLQNQLADWGLLWLVQVVFQLEFRAFAATLGAFSLVLAIGPGSIRWLRRQKVGDQPEFHRADLNEMMKGKSGTPTMGGLFLCGAILLSILLFADLQSRLVQLSIAVIAWLAVLGAVDDWAKLHAARRQPGSRDGLVAWEKLLFQLGLGLVVGYFLHRQLIATAPEMLVVNLPFQRTFEPIAASEAMLQAPPISPGLWTIPVWVFVPFAAIWIAFWSNAVNLTDGMDGLAGGSLAVSAIALMVLGFIAGSSRASYYLLVPHVPGAGELMVVSAAMAGGCLGFLWFNAKPAQVFMGDTGSLPLGGLLGFVSLALRQEVLMLLVGIVFVMELASVVMQVGFFKWTKGRRIFRCAPIHHHFQLGGWSEQQVVTRFWLITTVMTMLALASIKLR